MRSKHVPPKKAPNGAFGRNRYLLAAGKIVLDFVYSTVAAVIDPGVYFEIALAAGDGEVRLNRSTDPGRRLYPPGAALDAALAAAGEPRTVIMEKDGRTVACTVVPLAGKRAKTGLLAAVVEGRPPIPEKTVAGWTYLIANRSSLMIEGTVSADGPSLRNALRWAGQPAPGTSGLGRFSLKARANALAHSTDLMAELAGAHASLIGDDGDAPSAVGLLALARRAVDHARALDPRLDAVAERLASLADGLAAAAAEIADHARDVDADPAELVAADWPQLHRQLDGFIAAGLSKFVIRPVGAAPVEEFIDRFVAELLPRQN